MLVCNTLIEHGLPGGYEESYWEGCGQRVCNRKQAEHGDEDNDASIYLEAVVAQIRSSMSSHIAIRGTGRRESGSSSRNAQM